MTVRAWLRYMGRESRGSLARTIFFTACLGVGVAAVTAVAGLSSSIDGAIQSEAKSLLAADLAVEGSRPLPEELDRWVADLPGARSTRVREMVTVISGPETADEPAPSLLVELKAVEGEYPFYGTLVLEPDRPLGSLLDDGTVVVGPEVLERLRVVVGGTVRIGGEPFRIGGLVRKEPDRINFSLTLGPRIFLTGGGLERTALLRFGSRVRHRALIRMPDGMDAAAVAGAAERLEDSLPDAAFLDIETYVEAQPALRAGLTRAGRFLGIVALLSLLIGGIGVAQAVRSWLAGRSDAIAVLKSLGARPREILLIYMGQTALMGLAGSLVGVAAGMALQKVVPVFAGDALPVSVPNPIQPAAALRGMLLGMGVAVLFALPSLVAIRNVPPARVFRSDAEPLPGSRLFWAAAWGALLAGIGMMAVTQSGSKTQGILIAAGILALAGVLSLAALGLCRIAGRLPRRAARVWIRYGLAGLARPGAGTLGAIVALGMGVLVVLTIYLVQTHLGDQLRADLPGDAPTAFLVGIQPSQWDGVRRILEEEQAEKFESVPVVTARLRAVDGTPVDALVPSAADEGRRRWVLTREQRITYLENLPEDNVVVEGALWSDPDRAEISVEKDFARDLGAWIGSTLTFDIQGVPIDLVVTSIRTVEWEGFGINFFLVAEPGTLDDVPQYRVVAARLPTGSDQRVQDRLAGAYPNVTLLQIREILEKIVAVMSRLGMGVRLLGGFSILAGVAILGGAVSAGSVRRAREVALLKTLGMTRRGVVAVFLVEYALVGMVAGTIGAAGAGALAWMVVTRWMEIGWSLEASPYIGAIVAAIVLAAAAGVAASASALARRPIEVFRSL